MVEVFREVWRVLRDDGTLWLNMGDSYNSGTTVPQKPNQKGCDVGGWNRGGEGLRGRRCDVPALKIKDLIGVPWMLAFALRADGWYLRSDIIWSKPNPMPESVTDRPTKSHEYIFLLSKSERYYYNAEAIKEQSVTGDPRKPYAPGQVDARGNGHDRGGGSIRRPKAWNEEMGSNRTLIAGYERKHSQGPQGGAGEGFKTRSGNTIVKPDGTLVTYDWRNKRSVWEVGTQSFPEAHFATFPEDLIKPCILAGCPAGGTVLDPFVGSGTTILVARNLQCKGIGLELNPKYIEIAKRRLAQQVMEFCA